MKLKPWFIELLKTILGANDYCPNCRGTFEKGRGFFTTGTIKNDEGVAEPVGFFICLHCLENDLVDLEKVERNFLKMHLDIDDVTKNIKVLKKWKLGLVKYEVFKKNSD